MNFTRPSILFTAALCFLSIASTAHANYVQNGNFSTVSVSGNSLIYNYSSGSNNKYSGSSYLSNWGVIANSTNSDLGFVYTGSYGQNITNGPYSGFQLADSAHITASPDGGNFVVFDGDPGNSLAIYQTLTNLSANTTYTLTFYQATGSQLGFSPSGTVDFSVTFGNATDGYSSYTSTAMTASSNFSGWSQVTTTFKTGANAATETLQFLAQGPSGGPPMLFLDGVTLNTAISPTPEPSTVVVGGLGFLGLLGMRRKRAKSRA